MMLRSWCAFRYGHLGMLCIRQTFLRNVSETLKCFAACESGRWKLSTRSYFDIGSMVGGMFDQLLITRCAMYTDEKGGTAIWHNLTKRHKSKIGTWQQNRNTTFQNRAFRENTADEIGPFKSKKGSMTKKVRGVWQLGPSRLLKKTFITKIGYIHLYLRLLK